nr:MAG TPA: DNA-directed RNA polymerase II subunit [Caudoviricetes sp.]
MREILFRGRGNRGKCGRNISWKGEKIMNAKEALEKQIPKKPTFGCEGHDDRGNTIYGIWICPCCEDRYEVDYEMHNHCPTCGQAIDWSDER